MLMIRVIIAILAALAIASCTYAPRNTKIDQTYTARQMAVGMGDQPNGAMTSTTHEDESLAGSKALQSTQATNNQSPTQNAGMSLTRLEKIRQQRISGLENTPKVPSSNVAASDYITIGSTKADVARIQGTPKSIDTSLNMMGLEEWGYNDFDRIKFKNALVSEWYNSSGKLKVKMY